MVHTRIAVALACALSLAAVGCSSSSSSAEGGIGVTEQDFTITVSPSSVAAGSVTFNITNNGPSAHEFLVVKSDEDPGSLTVDKEGIVPEDIKRIFSVFESRGLARRHRRGGGHPAGHHADAHRGPRGRLIHPDVQHRRPLPAGDAHRVHGHLGDTSSIVRRRPARNFRAGPFVSRRKTLRQSSSAPAGGPMHTTTAPTGAPSPLTRS